VGTTHLILRASWVYDTRARNFVLTMLRLAAEREELRVVDDQIGSPTWARSIAEATAYLLRDIERARAGAGVYNLASLGSVSRYDFTLRMLELTRGFSSKPPPRLVRIKTSDFPVLAARPLNSALDNTKLAETFAVQLTDWDSQLRSCLKCLPAGTDAQEQALS
jgi:dTDP-4-dehydrorhamnose reductase